MGDLMTFSSDRVDVFEIILDHSESMYRQEDDMRKGLETFKRTLKQLSNKGSIAVAVSKFGHRFYSGDFTSVDEINTTYNVMQENTALYDAIIYGANELTKYMREITTKKNIVPRGTLIVFSDGAENASEDYSETDVKKMLNNLNNQNITTAFVAFGTCISAKQGAKLGFKAYRDVNDREALANFMGVELSQSCKEQSQSLSQGGLGASFFEQSSSDLGSSFFSHGNSKGFSQSTEQVAEEDDFFSGLADIF